MADKEQIILGIDPGTNILGYSVIHCRHDKISLISMSTIHMDSQSSAYEKLEHIYTSLSGVIRTYSPKEMAIEAPFYGKNVQSMLKLGRAQGVAIAAAMVSGLPVQEYSPKKVKSAITGNGNASKEQVAAMLLNVLKIETGPRYLDATDACAVAVCHYYQNKAIKSTTSYKGWKEFVASNEDRIV